jgi:hypothetical protein
MLVTSPLRRVPNGSSDYGEGPALEPLHLRLCARQVNLSTRASN